MKGRIAIAGAVALALLTAVAPGAHAFGLAEMAAATGVATGLAGSNTSAAASSLQGVRSSLSGSVAARDAAMRNAIGSPGSFGRGGAGTGGWFGYRESDLGKSQSWVTTTGGAGTSGGWASGGDGWTGTQQTWAGAGEAWAQGGVVKR